MSNEIRIDKWLWAVRLFKTRSLASEECRKNRILINDVAVKPSRDIRVGEIIQVKVPPIVYSYRVVKLPESRMGAKLVPEFMENVTPKEMLDLLEVQKLHQSLLRDRGTGRPTKRDRRDIDKFFGSDEV